jgi:hypothetical protein
MLNSQHGENTIIVSPDRRSIRLISRCWDGEATDAFQIVLKTLAKLWGWNVRLALKQPKEFVVQ